MIQTVHFSVEGMHCDACAKKLHKEMTSVPGVRKVSISFHDRRASIDFETSEVHINHLDVAINDAGFKTPPGRP